MTATDVVTEAGEVATGVNRIEILEWREHGDEEDSLEVMVYAADDATPPQDEIRSGHEEYVFDAEDGDPALNSGELCLCYTTNSATLTDGEIITSHNGRKFRISITEVAGA